MSLRRRMRSLPLTKVKLTDRFWSRWQTVLVEKTLPSQFEQLQLTGRFDNFRKAAGKEQGTFQGLWFNDSDVYKYIEACAYGLAVRPNELVRKQMFEAIALVEAAQEPDGYLNTYFQLAHPGLKWRNLNMMHEMYCGGHLIEGAVAVYENLGDARLLTVATRFAAHVMSVFGPEKRRGYCGHEEIELALIRLSAATEDAKYREFARWLVEQRGHKPSVFELEMDDAEAMSLCPSAAHVFQQKGEYRGEYAQDHAPIRRHDTVVGHAVRAMYYYIAAAELSDGLEDVPLTEALAKTWDSLVSRRMYVTGGIGPSASNEGFTRDFDLPNLTAYAETCASCGLIFWGHKMLELTANSDFTDVIERALYNGALSGISISGDAYFYTNPLESRGTHTRAPWFECACCPPNIARLIGSVGKYVVGTSEDTFYIHLPVGFEVECQLAGTAVKLSSVSDFPWSGKVSISVSPDMPTEFTLAVRIPGWASNVSTDIPGAEEEADFRDGYALFCRRWQAGDVLHLDFEMEPQWNEADPRVRDILGRVALSNGPLIYAAEGLDSGHAPQLFSADIDANLLVQNESMLGGINSITAFGTIEREVFSDSLYAPEGTIEASEGPVRFIPYYAWCNRGPTDMQVWVRRVV